MSARIARRHVVQALGATVALGALSAGLTRAQSFVGPTIGAPRQIDSGSRSDDALAASPVSSPTAEELASNVWAAMRGGMAPAVASLPHRVYVPHELGGDVAVIDPASLQIVDRYWVGRTPHHVAPSYSLDRLYVNVMDSSYLTVIDPHSAKPTGTIPVAVPYNLYFSPDGSKAIVAAEYYNRLDFFDPITWAPVARLPIPGNGVDHLDFSADGSYLLVSCEYGGQVVRVDVNQPAVTGVVRVGGLPIDVKLAPAGDVFYVANQGRHGVSIIDPNSMREMGFLPTGRGAHGLAVSRDTRALYVANRLAGTISVIDFEAAGIARTWVVGGSPDMLQVAPDGVIWASNRSHGAVSVIDSNNGNVLAWIRTGYAPHGLTYFPQQGRFSIGHNGVYR